MKYLVDKHKAVEITMEYFDDDWDERWVDITDDFFADGNLHCTVTGTDVIIVDDVDYCIDQARDWEARRMDYSFDSTEFERMVIVRDITDGYIHEFGACYRKLEELVDNFEKAFPACCIEKIQVSEQFYDKWVEECHESKIIENVFQSYSFGNIPIVMVKEQTEDAAAVLATMP